MTKCSNWPNVRFTKCKIDQMYGPGYIFALMIFGALHTQNFYNTSFQNHTWMILWNVYVLVFLEALVTYRYKSFFKKAEIKIKVNFNLFAFQLFFFILKYPKFFEKIRVQIKLLAPCNNIELKFSIFSNSFIKKNFVCNG